MSCHPCISSLVNYGLEAELKLTLEISKTLQEPIQKTKGTFDSMDFTGPRVFVELKRRGLDFCYHDVKIKEEGWLMPSCKVMKGWSELAEGKRVYFFYFWSFDKSLWMYEMKSGDFTEPGSHTVPKYHYDKMLHVKIPQDSWTFVKTLDELVLEEELCWIE